MAQNIKVDPQLPGLATLVIDVVTSLLISSTYFYCAAANVRRLNAFVPTPRKSRIKQCMVCTLLLVREPVLGTALHPLAMPRGVDIQHDPPR